MMRIWSLPALLLMGIALGPHGLKILTPSVVLLLDPIVAMALAMIGVFVGLNVDLHRPRVDASIAIAALGGAAIIFSREVSPIAMFLITLAMAGIAIVVAFASWLLVGQTDAEREPQVFVVGALLLVGGAAAYLSLSALFAGLFAGMLWNAAGDLARARIAKELDYFQHPLVVLLLLVTGASISTYVEAAVLGLVVLVLHLAARDSDRPQSAVAAMPVPLVAVALALDRVQGSDSMIRAAAIVLVVAAMLLIRHIGPRGNRRSSRCGARARLHADARARRRRVSPPVQDAAPDGLSAVRAPGRAVSGQRHHRSDGASAPDGQRHRDDAHRVHRRVSR